MEVKNLSGVTVEHFIITSQVAHKDGIILNLQSELDATQQEFENTVEELGQKDQELAKLKGLMRDMQSEIKELKSDREEHIEKVRQLIEFKQL